ncbi:hypothetical protein BgAZ_205770 [Babesia gibsoni]|uniref:Uncharacterized protein n=1 Tax=Babesia gibsoni TaxID=33632 RepID=A0AAD8PEB2_BABGI|nr:hypothetical protein BgAZ_205770 [Babesia gibsoni]
MDVSTYLVGLESNTVDEYHNTLCCFTFVAGIAAIMHWHFKRFINSTVDVVFSSCMICFIWRPTWVALTAMMTFSLTLFCGSLLLVGAGIIYQQVSFGFILVNGAKIVWSEAMIKNIQLLAYAFDIVHSLVIFWVLNAAWENPAKDTTMDDIDYIDYYENESVWTPYAGTGTIIAEYDGTTSNRSKK